MYTVVLGKLINDSGSLKACNSQVHSAFTYIVYIRAQFPAVNHADKYITELNGEKDLVLKSKYLVYSVEKM